MEWIRAKWRKFGPSITAGAGAVLAVVMTALTDNRIDPIEGIAIANAAATALLVHLIPVLPDGYGWTKKAVAGVMGVLSLGVQFFGQSWQADDWLLLVVTFLTTAGVLVVAPSPPSPIAVREPAL